MIHIIFFVVFSLIGANCLQCVDETNNNVDWYVLYKIPRGNHNNKLVKNGEAYLYMSSNSMGSWKLSNLSVNSSLSFLGNSLKPLYNTKKNKQLLHILYNDEPPTKHPNLKKGHTKGIVVADKQGGFWIVHSIPLFPPPSDNSYLYPHTGMHYGQSALCISFNAKIMNKIGVQLIFNEPQIYSSNIPTDLVSIYPKLNDVINHKKISNAPYFHKSKLNSLLGKGFLSFAKNKQFNKDLYSDWVAPNLKVGMYAETWLNGPGKLISDCNKSYSVNNVRGIKLEMINLKFKSSSDHSKWAVANNSGSNWICIGDINRAEHQLHRGGGTVCVNDKRISAAYRNSINSVEPCFML